MTSRLYSIVLFKEDGLLFEISRIRKKIFFNKLSKAKEYLDSNYFVDQKSEMNFELSENKNFLLKKKKTDGNKMEIWWRYLVITKIK